MSLLAAPWPQSTDAAIDESIDSYNARLHTMQRIATACLLLQAAQALVKTTAPRPARHTRAPSPRGRASAYQRRRALTIDAEPAIDFADAAALEAAAFAEEPPTEAATKAELKARAWFEDALQEAEAACVRRAERPSRAGAAVATRRVR